MARMFTGAGSIYADPAFQMGMALGNAYGNLWAHNAKERQKVKEEGIYNEMFGSNNDSNEIAQIAEMGSAGRAGTANTAANPEEARRQRLTNEVVMGGQTPQQIAASIMGNIPGTGNAAAGQNATDGALDYIQSQNQLKALGTIGQTQNPLYSVDDYVRRAREAGINQEIIDERLPQLQKETARRARETLLPGIANSLYGYTNADGVQVTPDYAQAFEDILRLRDYDPETAKVLMSGIVSPADLYNAQREDKARQATQQGRLDAMKQEYALKQQLKEQEMQKAADNLVRYGGMSRDEAMRYVLYGNIGGSKRTAGNAAKSPFESAEYKTAADTVEALDEKYSDGMGGHSQMSPEDSRRYKQAQSIMDAAWSSYFDTPQKQSVNANDYNAVGNYVKSIAEYARQNNINADEVAAALRQEMPNNPYLNDHLINYGLVKR